MTMVHDHGLLVAIVTTPPPRVYERSLIGGGNEMGRRDGSFLAQVDVEEEIVSQGNVTATNP